MTTQGRQGSLIAWTLALFIAIAAPQAGAQSADTPADSDTPPTDADLAGTRCVSGEEKILPGDYFYCLGTQTYGLGKYSTSQRFFKTAASWASKPAQYVLGVMALNGDNQPVNTALGLAWLTLASERANSPFRQEYDTAMKKATEADRHAAEQLLVSMRPIYGDATAAPRAERRYTDGMATLNRMSARGAKFCMAGMTDPSRPVADPSGCPPIEIVMKALDKAAVNVFDGWVGHVQVGPLEQVPAADAPDKK
jgi:hypothetical protein